MDNSRNEVKEKIGEFMNSLNTSALLFNLTKWAKGNEEPNDEVKKAFDILDSLFLNDYKDDFIGHIKKGTIFYRARKIEPKNYREIEKGIAYSEKRLYGFNADESKEPPIELAQSMRNSPNNVAALYLASDALTACTEVKPEVRQFISVARFEATQDMFFLDFSRRKVTSELRLFDKKYNVDIRHFLSVILFLFTEPAYSYDEDKYKVTQKIVEHYRKKKIYGYKYNSFYTQGKNYTFFDDAMKNFQWLDSRVVLNYATANLFLSLDKDCEINDMSSISNIEQNIADETREQLWSNIIGALNSKD